MQRQTWDDIVKSYPDEWVALANVEGDIEVPYSTISGEVIVHDRDEGIFTEKLKKNASPEEEIDIRYTGELLPDNPVGPILWQISDMNS